MARASASYSPSGSSVLTPRTAGRDRSVRAAGVSAAARVRWDRLGRWAMLFVLGALFYLYLGAGIRMLSTWHQARRDRAAVVAMEREHAALMRQHQALGRQGTIEAEARRLGMMKKGELQYVVNGLPSN
jgi:hypothetical protein